MSCLFLPAHSSYDRYSLSSKSYELRRSLFMESISGAFHIENEEYTHILSVSPSTLQLRLIFLFEHEFCRKHFWCFYTFKTKNIHISCLFLTVHSHLERRIYICLVCFCLRTLGTIDIPFRARIMNHGLFIESISRGFPHLERRMYTYLVCFCQRTHN